MHVCGFISLLWLVFSVLMCAHAGEWGVVTAVCVRESELEVTEGHNLLANFHGNDEAERQTKRETDPLPTDLLALARAGKLDCGKLLGVCGNFLGVCGNFPGVCLRHACVTNSRSVQFSAPVTSRDRWNGNISLTKEPGRPLCVFKCYEDPSLRF